MYSEALLQECALVDMREAILLFYKVVFQQLWLIEAL
jgi:hypothetical protein